MIRQLYLDHLSTTLLDARVLLEMEPALRENFGNPSNAHRAGLAARKAIQKAREEALHFLKAKAPEEIIFTSGGTEAANLAMKGLAHRLKNKGSHLVVGAIEHPSVLQSAKTLEKEGFSITWVAPDEEGKVDPADIEKAVQPSTILIAVQLANHDLGTIQPASEIGAVAKRHNILFYCDASAAGGWIPIDVQRIQADALSLSPHRYFGPKGVGILYCRKGLELHPLLEGGRQEEGRRAGTENVPAIVGAGAACRLAMDEMALRDERTTVLQSLFREKILSAVPHAKWLGAEPGPHRLPHHFSIVIEFVEGEALMLLLDLNGIAVTSGAGCVTRELKVSPSFLAAGLNHRLAQGVIQGGFGPDQTEADVDTAVKTIEKCVSKLRGMSLNWQDFQSGKLKAEIP